MSRPDPTDEACRGWLEISIQIHPVGNESLSAFLFDLGCTGVVIQDLRDPAVKAYLPLEKGLEKTRAAIEAFLTDLSGIFPEIQSPKLLLSHLEDQDWERNWRRFFHPTRVTPALMIYPAWEPITALSDGHAIRIDPGPAFGTGQHPTTRMCLETMEKVSAHKQQWSLLDVGTGSGILAIYGAKLGAAPIVGIDIDTEALRWAARNIELNRLTKAIKLSSRPIQMWRHRFSVVTANLVLGAIIELAPYFGEVMLPDAVLILSGLLRDQVSITCSALAAQGLRQERTIYEEEWACLLAEKQT
jgi:ribosomal protein L11 methyltransferase